MPRIAQRSIEQIKQQVNLVDVVSPYVQLKRAGKSWKGLSPFTQEKTPSFYVHPDRGFYKCFSTGEGGDAFTFVMKQENLEFYEAIEFLAKKFNITLEYEEGGPSREEVSLRKQIFEIHEIATDWFHQAFMKSDEAAPVRSYWKEQRGFDRETAEMVRIGYAPAAMNALALHMQDKGISVDAMRESGLFYTRDREMRHENFRSRFRGRLMIPIRDVQGRVVAFTARQLPQTPQDDPAREAKYVNSPETSIFHKGRILFGMDHARTHLKDGEPFLMVEGQLDAIRCWSVGLHTAVAPQGTAITEDQLHLMRRYEPAYIECLLDGDSAGRKAAVRTLPLAFKAGLEFRFLLLPDKVDPDDLLRNEGPAGLEPLRQEARSALQLAISDSLPQDRLPTTQEKTIALRAVFELIQHVPSEVAREDYIQTAAKIINVDPGAALRDFNKAQEAMQASPNARPAPKQKAVKQDPLLTQAAWELLWLVLHYPEYGPRIAQIIDYEWINSTSRASSMLTRVLAEYQEGLIEDISNLENLVDSVEDRQLLAEIHTRDLKVENPKTDIETCLKILCSKYLTDKIKKLQHRIANADPKSDQIIHMMKEVKVLRTALASPLPIEI
jgi:DNA primase, catalytic core